MPTCARGCRLLPVFVLLLAAMPRAAAAQTGTPTITVVATDSLASEVPTTSTAVAPSGSLVTSPVLSPIAAPVVGFGGGEFTIRLSQRSATALTVTFAIGGTARATSDYANVGVSVTVPAGATTFAIPVTVLDDKEVEPDETVVITLLAAAGYTVSSAPAVVTIVDADQAVELTATPHSLTEPASSTTVTVRRLGTLRGALVVRLAYTGSATRNMDYTAAADSVILLNGRSDATFPLTVRSDNSREGSETITVSATNVAMSQAPLSLAIADAATTLTGPATAVPEVEGGTIAFVLARTGDLSSAATFSLTLAGTASNGVDYQGIPTSVTIPAGAPSVTINALIRSDVIGEQAETLQLIVSPSTNYPGTAFTAQIAANGPLPTAVALSTTTAPFNTEVTGTVTLLEPAVAGTTITLASNNAIVTLSDAAGVIPYAASIAIPATSGTTTVGFRARTGNGSGSAVVGISATPAAASLTVGGVVTHVVGTAVSPTSPVLDTTSVPSGGSRQAVIRLSTPLTTTSFFQLASTNAAVQVPASVTIAENTGQMPFNLVAAPVTSLQQALITATRAGVVDTLTVKVLPSVAVVSVSLPAQVASGASGTGTVVLNQAAPAGGAVVQLTSNSPNLQVPTSVTVAANTTSAQFTANVPAFGAPSNQQAQLSATAGGATVSATVTLLAHTLSLVVGAGPFGGQSYSFDVRLNRPAPQSGIVATLTSSSTAFPLPASISFLAGDSSKTMTVQTLGVASNVAVVVTASFGASLAKNTVTLSRAQLATFTVAPFSTSGAGATAVGTLTLNGTAPPAGLQANVSNANPTRAAVPSVATFAANAGTTQFTMTTLPAVDAGDAGQVSVTVTLPDGQQKTATFSALAGIVVTNFTISPTTVAAGGSVTATVSIGQPAPAGGKTFPISVLAGASAVTVPTTVTIPQGAPSTTFTIATHTNTGGQAVTIGVGTKTQTLTITP